MKTIAKNMVQNTTWYLGGTTYKTSNPPYETYPVNELYESEKGIKVYSGHASTDTRCRQNLRSGVTYINNTLEWYTNM